MNIQELIKKYEEKHETVFGFPVIQLNQILEDLRQLDEPQKVQVPQFVADLIKYAKEHDWDLEDTFQDIAGNDGSSDIYQWYYTNSDNMDKFARAWLDGYTVEEEKRYRVKMKNIHSYSSILKLDDITGEYFFGSEVQMCASSSDHTRKELEEANFGWVFDCPGMEVEEVEG
jgi:hypothetical protein|nr:MAG TPA: Protein of unknown function (DUF1642) [Caudoviricetes sp.]